VLDRETGLLWERAPSVGGAWAASRDYCLTFAGGQRRGWRLPGLQEALSIYPLPNGHPFQFPPDDPNPPNTIWTATSDPTDSTTAWVAHSNGDANPAGKSSGLQVWCVRGGQGTDGQ
jgi:hypothetical protein